MAPAKAAAPDPAKVLDATSGTPDPTPDPKPSEDPKPSGDATPDPFAPQVVAGNGGNLDPRATAACVAMIMQQDPATYGDGTGFTCPALTVQLDGGFGTRQFTLRNAVAEVLKASGFDLGSAIDGTPFEVAGWRSKKGAKQGDTLQYGVTIVKYFPAAMSEEDRAIVRAANVAAKVAKVEDPPADTGDAGAPADGTGDAS